MQLLVKVLNLVIVVVYLEGDRPILISRQYCGTNECLVCQTCWWVF